jgi:prephenate dehydratase
MTLPVALRVGIQGVAASFHDEAARKFFRGRQITPIPFSSFPLLCKGLREKSADVALMAIENSIAGSILPNYSLLESNLFQILGEVYLRIKMNLMAIPGQNIEDIQFVKSHPMALLQCEDFLMSCPWMKVIEGSDTAASAKEIQETGKRGYAAIASLLAAETYGLELMRTGIESNAKNYTRFLVICRGEDYQPSRHFNQLTQGNQTHDNQIVVTNKASFRFEVPDQPGSLVRILRVLDQYSVNMTHLQSVVIPGKPYEYSFHIDLEWKDADSYQLAMEKIMAQSLRLIHLGVYPRGERPAE